jgi:hypothetical protein
MARWFGRWLFEAEQAGKRMVVARWQKRPESWSRGLATMSCVSLGPAVYCLELLGTGQEGVCFWQLLKLCVPARPLSVLLLLFSQRHST